MKLLLGEPIAEKIYQEIKEEMARFKIKPGLAVIMVGKNEASQVYVGLKEKTAKRLGFTFKKFLFSSKISEKKIIKLIKSLNKNKKIHGLIVQLPLPKNLHPLKIIRSILPEKDIDGFHPKTKFISPIHQAILKLLSFYKIKIKNKKIAILANSLIFAQPLARMLRNKGAKVKIILKNNYSPYSPEYRKCLKRADILIIAIGKPKFLKKEMVKNKAVIVDIGYSRVKKKAVGDVDFESCAQKVSALSPVPGGVGPLTVAYLMRNVLKAAKN
ncbi:MAG: bifunctional 5,10-methylenetetrahydrofolate dehydrogenase/5,10-methenyltetrahydrofolate cyclohydrolase [Patescibacteria group bacterium]|nr:bifunctional 5,10-methylenetetrahydrofolate dehydrogenase/5,10-methenyltetrahydrofolate cyclohydrolase [Patescibacteria group bacterium]